MSAEELIELAEETASCESLAFKAGGRKVCKGNAYANPKFVEDIDREITIRLKNDPRNKGFYVES